MAIASGHAVRSQIFRCGQRQSFTRCGFESDLPARGWGEALPRANAKLSPCSTSARKKQMKQVVFTVAFGLLAAATMPAFAKADCKAYPKAEWMKEAEAKSKIEAQGYTISKFKVDGNCYEIYGRNKAGKKVEIYYDAKTLEPVKSEIEK
jgi:hypothetical protein